MKHSASVHSSHWADILAIVIVAVILANGWFWFREAHPLFSQMQSGTTPRKIETLRNQYTFSNRLETDFTYRQGCSHCMAVQPYIAPVLKEHLKRHQHLIVVNNRTPALRKYVGDNNLIKVPTVSIRYHGYLIYQYTGRNVKKLKRALNDRNPDTNQRFRKKMPQESTIVNDINGTTSREPAYQTQFKN